MLPALKGLLLCHPDRRSRPGARELVFRTRRGGQRTKDNVRLRILLPALARGEELLEARGQASLPPVIIPHSLHHTFASLLFAIGEDPVSVMRQLGHTDPAFSRASMPTQWAEAPTSADGYVPSPTATRWSARRGCNSNDISAIRLVELNGCSTLQTAERLTLAQVLVRLTIEKPCKMAILLTDGTLESGVIGPKRSPLSHFVPVG